MKQLDLIICSSDKNLAPCTIERKCHVQIAFDDHLGNKNNCQQLAKAEATQTITDTRMKIDALLDQCEDCFIKQQCEFVTHHLKGDEVKLIPQFCLMMKFHKGTLGSRPIVSLSGTALHGLGV